jgi:electron transfer flavoprotein alpha/beta subunit
MIAWQFFLRMTLNSNGVQYVLEVARADNERKSGAIARREVDRGEEQLQSDPPALVIKSVVAKRTRMRAEQMPSRHWGLNE